MNRMLLGENQLLRSKLRDTEKLNDTLRNENNMFSKLHSQSTQDTGHQSTDDLLAGFVTEMRELRLRLEDSKFSVFYTKLRISEYLLNSIL